MNPTLKKQSWKDLPRETKRACVLYPGLAPPEIQREMNELAKGEGKRSPTEFIKSTNYRSPFKQRGKP
jgi:hypothetical protein